MPQSSWLPQFAPNTFAEERHDASQDVDGRHAERVARKCSTSCAVGARAADGSGHGTGRSPEDGFVAAVGIFYFWRCDRYDFFLSVSSSGVNPNALVRCRVRVCDPNALSASARPVDVVVEVGVRGHGVSARCGAKYI